MTKKKTRANHTQPQERTTHGESGERTAARARARTKRAGKQEIAPAKAAAQKPRRAGSNRPPDEERPAGSQPAKTVHSRPAKRGLARLQQEARNIVEKDARGFLKGINEKARNGSANDFKLLVDLAGLIEQEPAADRDDERRAELLQDLSTQPEYQEPPETAGNVGSPQDANFQAAGASAKNLTGTTNDTV